MDEIEGSIIKPSDENTFLGSPKNGINTSIPSEPHAKSSNENNLIFLRKTFKDSLYEHRRRNRTSLPLTVEVEKVLQDQRDKLLLALKVQVKQLAEMAVMRKYIHEESSLVTSFCAAVDACLMFGLISHRIGREPSTHALILELAKVNKDAANIVQRIQALDGSSGINWNLLRSNTTEGPFSSSMSTYSSPSRIGSSAAEASRRRINGTKHVTQKYQWIRMALFDKKLDKIVDFLVKNPKGYYERVSIPTHPCDAYLFAHLLRGPCTHDYTRIRTSDHLWTDPSAGELLQRQRIFSAGMKSDTDYLVQGAIDGSPVSSNFRSTAFQQTKGLTTGSLANSSSLSTNSQTMDSFPRIEMATQPGNITPATLLYNVTANDGNRRPVSLKSYIGKRNINNTDSEFNHDLDNNFSSLDSNNQSVASSSASRLTLAKDYVESLLQNDKSPLIYGKNNVTVQPSMSSTKIPGYLSIHQSASGRDTKLLLKWVPNRAMSTDSGKRPHKLKVKTSYSYSGNGTDSYPESTSRQENSMSSDSDQTNNATDSHSKLLQGSTYWDFALNIDFDRVVYLHCHRNHVPKGEGTLVLVREDGVQFPHLIFPTFNQLITFIQCLEHNLPRDGSLEPTLSDVDFDADLAHESAAQNGCDSDVDTANRTQLTPFYYCFRIKLAEPGPEIIKEKPPLPFATFSRAHTRSTSRHRQQVIKSTSSMSDLMLLGAAFDLPSSFPSSRKGSTEAASNPAVTAMQSFENTCSSMRFQILSRVFGAWLAYSRSINRIRKELSDIVFPLYILREAPPIHPEPVTLEYWKKFRRSRSKSDIRELYKRIYFGGCEHSIRREVWPFLLGHYPWCATDEEIDEIDRTTRAAYERSVSEWLSVEAINRQREKQANHERELNDLELTLRMEAERYQHSPHLSSYNANTDGSPPPTIRRSRWSSLSRSNTAHNDSEEKQPAENIFFEAWKIVKRKLSTVTVNSKQNSEISKKSSPSFPLADSGFETSRLTDGTSDQTSAAPCFTFHSEITDVRESTELTDETEDYTLTTTDEEPDCSSTRQSRRGQPSNRLVHAALSRAQSLPSNQQTPSNSISGGHTHNARESHSAQKSFMVNGNGNTTTVSTESGEESKKNGVLNDEVFHEKKPEVPPRKRKRSRYAKEDIAGSCYSNDVLNALSVNIHRIDKDVARCDRNYPYFAEGLSCSDHQGTIETGGLCVANLDSSANLYRLRTIMCTWTWEHMDTGYVQGMCDLLAPLLVILDDEALTHACFCQLMSAMLANFPLPSSGASGVVPPDQLETVVVTQPMHSPNSTPREYVHTRPRIRSSRHTIAVTSPAVSPTNQTPSQPLADPSSSFALGSSRIYRQFKRLRALLDVLDPILANHMHLNEENAHLYFFRWLLLDFKRELKYEDVFLVWETIWASRRLVSDDFGVFVAFALIQCYRDIIIFYCMDYTDIIRFYNERAELHDVHNLLSFARDMIYRLQMLITSS